jgi:hypothetical protein
VSGLIWKGFVPLVDRDCHKRAETSGIFPSAKSVETAPKLRVVTAATNVQIVSNDRSAMNLPMGLLLSQKVAHRQAAFEFSPVLYELRSRPHVPFQARTHRPAMTAMAAKLTDQSWPETTSPVLGTQWWLASSRHRFGLYKWSLCRLMG